MLHRVLSALSPSQKSKLRGWYQKGRVQLVQWFRSYDPASLKRHLQRMGLQRGDTLLVHCAYGPHLGFRGSPTDLIDAFADVIGPTGNLLMVSMPYFSSTKEYLERLKVFDVRKTASKMGLISETFRKRVGVVRSLHPTHPVLALGPKAEWIVSGHDTCLYPCGVDSPFGKLVTLEGKVLFYGVTEFHFTFHHYLEDLIKNDLPFPLYEEEPYLVKVLDNEGQTRFVKTFVFTQEAIRRRRVNVLFDELTRRHQLQRTRIGNTSMVLMNLVDTVNCTKDLAKKGIYFYNMN